MARGLWQDVRFALRQLRLNPGFAAGAALPLALAIGCVGAVLALADGVLYRATGVRDPARVAAIYTFSRTQSRYLSDSYPDFRDISGLSELLESTAAYLRGAFSVRLGEGAEQRNGELVTGDYFRAAGIVPEIGRPLTPEDDRPGAQPVALISDAVWENQYGRSGSALGSIAWINSVPFTIVGVMPRGYQGMLLDWYGDSAFWFPLAQFTRVFPGTAGLDFSNQRAVQMLMILARLRPGVKISQLQAALDVLAPRVAAKPDYRFTALAAAEARFFPAYRAGTIRYLWMLLAVSMAAVAIACFNLAGLLLARASAREKEIAARLAVGASRRRLLQQFVVENAVLAVCACALAIPVTLAAAPWLMKAPILQGIPLTLDESTDWRALGIGMLAGLGTAVLIGLIPALKASRGDIAPGLKAGRTPRLGLADFFVAAQVGCAMTVLAPAAMVARDVARLSSAPLGYDARGVLIGTLDLNGGGIRSADQIDRVERALLEDLRPQAPAVALASSALPTTMRPLSMDASADGSAWKQLAFTWVGGGYLETMRTPILSGRGIEDRDDRHAAPVVVLNEAAAALLWPGQNPVGRLLRFRQGGVEREVVGVAANSRFHPLGFPDAELPCLFLPLGQRSGPTNLDIHVRTAGAPLEFASALRRAAARVAPNASLSGIHTLQEQTESGLKPMRVAEQAVSAASLFGITLALAGVFAASAYRVMRQRKEIAIRIALGAEPGRVILRFASRGLWIGVAGAVAGLAPTVWSVGLLRASVNGAGSPEAWILGASGGLLGGASMAAAWMAARRIARVQPAEVLRVQ